MSCIFCRIIKGEIPCFKVAETAKALCFMDINPLSKGHCLVIPKECCAKVHELSDETMADVGVMLRRAAKAAQAAGHTEYNVLQNNGAGAGQEVMHVHFHIIPKLDGGDGLRVSWKPQQGDMAAIGDLSKAIAAEYDKLSS